MQSTALQTTKQPTRLSAWAEVPLSDQETKALVRCEKAIKKGIDTFRKVGAALLQIRNQKLYRLDHATFNDYCREQWGFNDSRARQLIAAAKTAATVEISTALNEGQAKELTRVPTDQRQAVLNHAKEKSDGKPLTATVIRKAAEEVLEAKPEEDVPDDATEATSLEKSVEPVVDAAKNVKKTSRKNILTAFEQHIREAIPTFRQLALLSDGEVASSLLAVAAEWDRRDDA